MKKTLLTVSLALASSLAFAQQRMVFVEGFSQASCGPCAQQNPALNAILEKNHDKVVSVKYQTSWPGTDPMNAQNPSEVATRVNVYTVSGVPSRCLDGVEDASITQAAINTRLAVPSPVSMDVAHTMSADSTKVSFNVKITAPETWTPSNTVIHIAMVE